MHTIMTIQRYFTIIKSLSDGSRCTLSDNCPSRCNSGFCFLNVLFRIYPKNLFFKQIRFNDRIDWVTCMIAYAYLKEAKIFFKIRFMIDVNGNLLINKFERVFKMNQATESKLRSIYRMLTIEEMIYECDEIVFNIDPDEMDYRINTLIDHVTRAYNSEMFVFTFDDRRYEGFVHIDYGAHSSHNMFVGSRHCHITSYGSNSDILHLMSLLHEIGHGIDFRGRKHPDSYITMEPKEVTKKEIVAWVYGLRLGLEFGYITKEELDQNFFRCMRCLMTYLKDFGWELDDAINVAKNIYEEVVQ